MTWPLPDLPKLPPAPTREERKRERQAQLEALEAEDGGHLPPGVTRREDGSFHTVFWRRDDVWTIGGMTFAFVLLVAFLAYWTTGAPSRPSSRSSSGAGPGKEAATPPTSAFWWVVGILIVVFMVAIAAYVVWALVTIFRGKGVRYEDVSAEEQARRREVARLLKQVEPAVSLEDAERQLGHVPPERDTGP